MDIVIGAEVFLCMTEPVLGAGQSLGVRNVATTIERGGWDYLQTKVTFRQFVQ